MLMAGLVLAANAVCVIQPAGGRPLLTTEGRPLADIVIAEKPPHAVKLAAKELQEHLFKMSGATLVITNAPGTNLPLHIFVGRSTYTDQLGVTDKGLEHGAFRMVSVTNGLVLLGHDEDFKPPEPMAKNRDDRPRALKEWDERTGATWLQPMELVFKSYNAGLDIWEYDQRGSLNAVHEFLRLLGVRWYFPGEIGTVMPKLSGLELPALDVTCRPDFPIREFIFYRTYSGASRDEVLWYLRLGLNPGAELVGTGPLGHGIVMVHGREEVKRAHPEYFALWGKRATAEGSGGHGKPCLSAPGLFEDNVRFVRKYFDIYNAPMVSVMPADGYSQICQCELCKGKDTPERGSSGRLSDYAWDYVNRVAIEVRKTHPDKKILCFAYGSYLLPPEKIGKLSPNIVVGLCQWRSMFYDKAARAKALELRQAWRKKTDSGPMVIWEYYLHARPGREWESIPAVFPHLAAEDLRSLMDVSMGDFIEVYNTSPRLEDKPDDLAINHLNLYITARLYWDTAQDTDKLLDDYYKLFYGPAAREMKRFFEFCEANWPSMRSRADLIKTMFELLQAGRKAAGDSVYGKRVELIERYVEPLAKIRGGTAGGGGFAKPARPNAPAAYGQERPGIIPVIDGRLDEPFWKGQQKYPFKDLCTGLDVPPESRTIFISGWDRDALCFGISCHDSDMANLNITATNNHDEALWFGDSVDIILETDLHAYYQIGVNPAGAVSEADRNNEKINMEWRSGAQVAVRREADHWSIEIRIPAAGSASDEVDPLQGVLGSKPWANHPWFFNICRQRVREGRENELSAFSPAGKPAFHDRAKFGELYIK